MPNNLKYPEWLTDLVNGVLGILTSENEEEKGYVFRIHRDVGWNVRIYVLGFVPVLPVAELFDEGMVDVLSSVSETSIAGTVGGCDVQVDFDFDEPVVHNSAPIEVSALN
jgi:hypothetical protein